MILHAIKDPHVYLLRFDPRDHEQALAALLALGRWAGDARLNFTWYDAARLSDEIRRTGRRRSERRATEAHDAPWIGRAGRSARKDAAGE